MKRQTKKQDQRRKIDYQIKHNSIERENPSQEEIMSLFSSIRFGRSSDFSLLKLSKMNIETLYELPDQFKKNQKNHKFITLLNLSLLHGKPEITRAILRAGAHPFNPGYFDDEICEKSCFHEDIKNCSCFCDFNKTIISKYPSSYIIWLMKLCYYLSNIYDISNNKRRYCDICEIAVPTSSTSRKLLNIIPCNHVICTFCFWENIDKLDKVNYFIENHNKIDIDQNQIFDYIINNLFEETLICPCCSNQIAKFDVIEKYFEMKTDCITNCYDVKDNLPHFCFLPDLKDISFQKFNELPDGEEYLSSSCKKRLKLKKKDLIKSKNLLKEIVDSDKGNTENPAFNPCHLSKLSHYFIRYTKKQRAEEWLKVVGRGDLRKMVVLINHGIDLDGIENEYSQNALYISVLKKNSLLVKFLLKVGMNPNIQEETDLNLGYLNYKSALVAAIFKNDCKVLKIFQSHYKEKSLNIPKFIKASASNNWEISSSFDDLKFSPNITNYSIDIIFPNFIEYYKLEEFVAHDPKNQVSMDKIMAYYDAIKLKNQNFSSFCVQNCFSSSFLGYLDLVFRALPVAKSHKQSCSDRSYFFDFENLICSVIEGVIQNSLLAHSEYLMKSEDGIEDESFSVKKVIVFPHFRFLNYLTKGGYLEPHIDLNRTEEFDFESKTMNITSTHTVILYLSDCDEGGETILLTTTTNKKNLPKANKYEELKKVQSENQFSHSSNSEKELNIKQQIDIPSDLLFKRIEPNDERFVSSIRPERGKLFLFPHHSPHAAQPVDSTPKLLLRGEVFIPNNLNTYQDLH